MPLTRLQYLLAHILWIRLFMLDHIASATVTTLDLTAIALYFSCRAAPMLLR
jgi:hypothetical protein